MNEEPVPKTRLLLIDDHALFREGLARLLASEPDFEMATPCANVDEALRVLQTSEVDLILLDYDLGPRGEPGFWYERRNAVFTDES